MWGKELEREEPIQFVNCSGIAGIMHGEAKFFEAREALLGANGISYREKDKSGIVVDCSGGFLSQAFFNSFFSFPEHSGEIIEAVNALLSVGWGGGIFKAEDIREKEGIPSSFIPALVLRKENFQEQEKRLHELKKEGRSKAAILIESVVELEREDLEKVREMKDRSDLLLARAHMDPGEVFRSIELYGKTPIERLLEHELLSDNTVVVGGDWITGRDAEAVRSASSWISHLPLEVSELGMGSSFPIIKFIDKNYQRVLLGTGIRCFDSPLFLASFSRLLYRFISWSTAPDSRDVLKMLWVGWKLVSERTSCIEEGCAPPLYLFAPGKTLKIRSLEDLATNGYLLYPSLLCYPGKGCTSFGKELNIQ